MREDVFETAIAGFYAERVFGRSRVALLSTDLASYADRAAQERGAGGYWFVSLSVIWAAIACSAEAGIGPSKSWKSSSTATWPT